MDTLMEKLRNGEAAPRRRRGQPQITVTERAGDEAVDLAKDLLAKLQSDESLLSLMPTSPRVSRAPRRAARLQLSDFEFEDSESDFSPSFNVSDPRSPGGSQNGEEYFRPRRDTESTIMSPRLATQPEEDDEDDGRLLQS